MVANSNLIKRERPINALTLTTYNCKNHFNEMAEAMINDKYLQATLPTLPLNHQNENTASRDGHRKVVGFDIDVPPVKRPKPNATITAQSVTLAIQTSVSSKDRLDSIYEACAKFDHGIEAAHDAEVAMGADIALFKHLPFLLLKKNRIEREILNHSKVKKAEKNGSASGTLSVDMAAYGKFDHITIMEEISNTFTALEMVLRCSADSVSTCFARIGTELLPLIIDLIHELMTSDTFQSQSQKNPPPLSPSSLEHGDKHNNDSKQKSNFQSGGSGGTGSTDSSTVSGGNDIQGKAMTESTDSGNGADASNNPKYVSNVILKTCTKILGHFARVGSLTETLANTAGLLSLLNNIITAPEDEIPIEAKLNSLWIVANLACSADNMTMMTRHPRLIKTLTQIASHPSKHDEGNCEEIVQYISLLRARSIAVRAILNLSWSHGNKVPFAENADILEALLCTASHRKSSWAGTGKGVSGILLQSRRHAAGALRNLAAAPRKYKRRLCRFRSGSFLDTLADIAKNDYDDFVKEKIHATLFNLVSADTAKIFTEKKDVLDVIVSTATSNCTDENSCSSLEKEDARAIAVRTLRSLEKALPEDDEGYDILRPALSRFDSQITINRSISNLRSVSVSVTNLGTIPSISNNTNTNQIDATTPLAV